MVYPVVKEFTSRQMRRRFINFAFAVSVGLFAIFCVAWPMTYTAGYTGAVLWNRWAVLLDTCRGEVSLWVSQVIAPTDHRPHYLQMIYDRNEAATTEEWFLASKADKSGFAGLHFAYVLVAEDMVQPISQNVPPGKYAHGMTLPLWLLCALTGIWPTLRAIHGMKAERGKQRLAQGLCPRCGYDLRATPERCPECGWAPDPATIRSL